MSQIIKKRWGKKFIDKRNKASESETRFILTSEISNIYSKNGHGRRIHNIIFAPSFDISRISSIIRIN